MSNFQYKNKFPTSPWDYGYYAELETISDNKANLAFHFYNDDGHCYWLYLSLYIDFDTTVSEHTDTKYIYIMDMQGFSLHGLDLNTMNSLEYCMYDINTKNDEFDILKSKIISQFYVHYKYNIKIKTREDFIVNKTIKKMIYNVIDKPQITNIFKDILPYDVIDTICNLNQFAINVEDYKITKKYNYDKFITMFDTEDINKEWFVKYDFTFMDSVY